MGACVHLEPMLAEATIHDDHAYGVGRLGMPVMLLSCGVSWWKRNWCVSSASPVACSSPTSARASPTLDDDGLLALLSCLAASLEVGLTTLAARHVRRMKIVGPTGVGDLELAQRVLEKLWDVSRMVMMPIVSSGMPRLSFEVQGVRRVASRLAPSSKSAPGLPPPVPWPAFHSLWARVSMSRPKKPCSTWAGNRP